MSPLLVFQWFLFWFHILFTCSTSKLFDIPRIIRTDPTVVQAKFSNSSDFEEKTYDQRLDHFGYTYDSNQTFKQRYIINTKYWGGASNKSPFFVYLGNEAPLDRQNGSSGFLLDNALQFEACLVYIEHRYYGKSSPLGSQQQAMQNESIRGHFNSAQALTDFAEIINYIKNNLSAESCPVIVFGCSYGGMLASWFRLKYPHVALGAMASSAPILYFDDITPEFAYFDIIDQSYRNSSQTCFDTIKDSWVEIDSVANQPNGLQNLSTIFKACNLISSSSYLINELASMYIDAAQYNYPSWYPVDKICQAINGAPSNYILDKISAGVAAYRWNRQCYINQLYDDSKAGWHWQQCTEMVFPISRRNGSMLPPYSFDLKQLTQECYNNYHVIPRPHWVTTYYGGHNITTVLKRFGSNIIFSNGLKDPYSAGGVLEDISSSVRAVKTDNGCHCLDIRPADTATDPKWLVDQRKTEVQIIQGWIDEYNKDIKITTSTILKKIGQLMLHIIV